MKKRNHKATVLLAVICSFILLMVGATGIVLIQKFMRHELSQNERLSDVEARIDLLEAKGSISNAASVSDSTIEEIWRGGVITI